MRISAVETIILRPRTVERVADSSQDCIIVLVHTDEGLVGVGEADSSPEVVRAIIDAPASSSLACGLRELIVGEDPLEPERVWEKMYRGSIFFGRRGAAIQAMSAIDIALWDLVGQAQGRPVHGLLGGAKRNQINCYASVLMPETPEAAYEQGRELAQNGFRAAKFGWGPLGRDATLDSELVHAARDGIGDTAALMVDIGFAWRDAQTAIKRLDAIAGARPAWIEEPLPPDDLTGYAHLAEATDIPLAAGEEETTHWPFRELIEQGKITVVQPDVTRVGGYSEIGKVFALARQYGVRCVPHAWSSPLTQLATVHMLATTDEDTFLELQFPTPEFLNEVCDSPLHFNAGVLNVPCLPGLGVQLDRERLTQARTAL